MTQALLNNLNINTDDNFQFNDKVAKEDSVDFSKILQKKSSKIEDTYSEISTNEKLAETETSKAETIGELKNNDTEETDNLNNIIADAIFEAKVIECLDLTFAQEEIENSEALTELNIDNEEAEEIEEVEETQDKQETMTTEEETITEEDPTMNNKEMLFTATLENPATAMMLQSQMQNYSQERQNSDSQHEENNEITLKNNETNSILKSYDNIQKNAKELSFNTDNENNAYKTDKKTLKDIVDKKVINELNIEQIETESSAAGSNTGDLMNNQSPQEQAVKVFLQTSGSENSKLEFTSMVQNNKVSAETNTNRILQQISKQIEGLYNSSKVNIVLNPESLGKVSLQIINLKEGLSAQFTVTTQDAQNAILKGLSGLKETLMAHGINVDNVTVKVQESGDSDYHSDWTEQEGSRGGNKQQNPQKQKEDEKQFEQMMFELNKNDNV